MYLIKIEEEDDENVISFRNPALSDIALEVCTPVQIAAIKAALLARLGPIGSMNFRVPLLMAELHHELGKDEETKKQLWISSYEAFKSESKDWTKREVDKWKELIEDEIQAAGYNASDILGGDIRIDYRSKPSVPHTLPLLKIYSAPVSFGPMGHSLSVITRNTFHEWGAFHGAKMGEIKALQAATKSAADRYLKEMAVIEDFLNQYNLSPLMENLQKERDIIAFLATPAGCKDDVLAKALKVLDQFIPEVVESRLKRLHALMAKLSSEVTPAFVAKAGRPILKAYECLKCNKEKLKQDSAQHALMILATMNWKPKQVPEYLPSVHYQTVANVRNKTIVRLSVAQAIVYRHQQTVVDFEAFLIVTALLDEAHTQGKC
jgi:hypothetical protein